MPYRARHIREVYAYTHLMTITRTSGFNRDWVLCLGTSLIEHQYKLSCTQNCVMLPARGSEVDTISAGHVVRTDKASLGP